MVSWALVEVVTVLGVVVVAIVVGEVFVVTLAMDFVVVVCARAVVVTAFAGVSQGTVELTFFAGRGTIDVGNALVLVTSAAGAIVVVVAKLTAALGGKSSCNLIATGTGTCLAKFVEYTSLHQSEKD